MNKTIKLPTVNNERASIEINFENGRLSITGETWYKTSRWHEASGGQCYEAIAEMYPDDERVQRIVEIWKRWHLNDMRAGTPKQEAYINEHPEAWSGAIIDSYARRCEALENAGLLEDNGYKYGSAWLTEEVPSEIIAELTQLTTPKEA